MTRERANHIDIAKGIAIILVVYGHAAAQWKETVFYENNFRIPNLIIFSVVMPIFFMISGAFQRQRLESPNFTHKGYLLKILQSILLPFYSLSAIFLIINVCFQKFIEAPTLQEMLFALLIQQSGDSLPSGVLWFLFTLFLFAITTYLFAKLLKIHPLILLVFAIFLRSELNPYSKLLYLSFDHYSTFYIFYIFGYIFNELITKQPIHKTKSLFLILLCYAFLLISNSTLSHYYLCSLLGATSVLGSLFIIGFSFNLNESFDSQLFVKILIYYGAYSILVYVFHMPTFTIIKKIMSIIPIENGYGKQLFLFIPGIVFPLLYGKILSKNKFIYKFLLGRNP